MVYNNSILLSKELMKIRTLFRACLAVFLSAIGLAQAAQVTFQVDLSAQRILGNFNPETDTIFVAGDPLNNWSASASQLEQSTTDTNLWAGTFDVSGVAGGTGQYKFVMTTATATFWEGEVGSGGTTGNRTFTLSDTDQVLPVVFFNNVTNTTSVTAQVTFQVNLAVEVTLGNFDPSSGTVYLAGEFNAWNATGFELTRSTENPDIWAGTLTLSGTPESEISYKFVMNGSTWENTVGTNGSQNRAMILQGGNQVLPVVYFNNLSEVPSQVPITFQVDLGVQTVLGNFFPDSDTVYVAGDLINNWSGSTSALTRSASDTNLWTGTYEIQGLTGTVMYYKFVINGSTWESIDNRKYTFAGTNAQTLPKVYFNNAGNLGKIAVGVLTSGQLTLTWTANPVVQLQKSTAVSGQAWETVPDTLGQGTATIVLGGGAAFFRLATP
jgi:hypothetical protein